MGRNPEKFSSLADEGKQELCETHHWVSFTKECLRPNPRSRACLAGLLQHPFITQVGEKSRRQRNSFRVSDIRLDTESGGSTTSKDIPPRNTHDERNSTRSHPPANLTPKGPSSAGGAPASGSVMDHGTHPSSNKSSLSGWSQVSSHKVEALNKIQGRVGETNSSPKATHNVGSI
jgi:hypothetical protein